MKKPLRPLTAREQKFVEEYLVDLNGYQAAQRAGYARTSADHTFLILRRPQVAAAIKEAMGARARRTRITVDRVLREYARIAFADVRNFATEEGGLRVKSLKELSDDEAAAVAEVTSKSDGKSARLKLHDKKKALDAIARHLGFFGRSVDPDDEDPEAAADRVRELILGRIARLTGPDETS